MSHLTDVWRKHVFLSFGAFVVLAASAAARGDGAESDLSDQNPTVEYCPVMPEQLSYPQFQTNYQGRRVHFCCADCVRRFEADPDSYAGNLPPLKPLTIAPGAKEPWADYLLRHLQPIISAAEYAAARPWLSGYLLAILLLTALAVRKRRRLAAGKRSPRWSDRFSRPFVQPAAVAALVFAGLCIQFATELWSRPAALAEPIAPAVTLEYSTNSTFAWPQAFHEMPRGLASTYYRGNDERNAGLFNGGRYRTATLHVSIRNDAGESIESGQAIGGKPIFVRCQIVRAANTASGFFMKNRMAEFRLIRTGGINTKADSVPLSVLREDWEWVADAPIGRPNGKGYEGFRGVWFLGTLGDRGPHFGIQYCVHLQDGKVLPESVIWMYSVLQSPILDGPMSDGEWFSDRPISEIPDGKSVTDPKLLGLTSPNGPGARKPK